MHVFLGNEKNQRGNRLREPLSTFITLHKARVLYHWEVAANTKLLKDSSLGNAVCSSGCRTKNTQTNKKTLFFLASHAPKN
jgi:hypothetical protein